MWIVRTENEDPIPTPALFSGWEPFLFSLGRISMEKKVDKSNANQVSCLMAR